MLEAKGNIFTTNCDALCITTNGYVTRNGDAVMGRGCAKQAAEYVPNLKSTFGKLLKHRGNIVQILAQQNDTYWLNFPVKPHSIVLGDDREVVRHMRGKFEIGDTVPGWACVADYNMIVESALQLVDLTDRMGWKKVILPRPGCGFGELSWTEVKPVLDKILDDRFVAMTF